MAKKARDWLKKEMNNNSNNNNNPGGKSIDELFQKIIQSIQRIHCTTINWIENVNKQVKGKRFGFEREYGCLLGIPSNQLEDVIR